VTVTVPLVLVVLLLELELDDPELAATFPLLDPVTEPPALPLAPALDPA